MSTKVISGAKPRFHHLLPNHQSTKETTPQNISFRNPIGSVKTRSKTRIQAFYAPTAEINTTRTETLYEVLGISENEINLSDIKKAYKQMARKYHPDVSPPDRVDENTRRFIMVHEAYETLSDPHTRASYDRALAGFSFSGQRNHHQYNNQETGEWKMRWQSQVDELKRRNVNKEEEERNMSWGARMRNKGL